jgi:predicted secreted protein
MGAILQTLAASTLRTVAVMVVVLAAVVVLAVGLFKLTVFGALALYFVVWWTLLFVILPLRNQVETDPERIVPGQDPGAPAAPRLREKAILTSVLASVVFLAAIQVFELAGL